MMRQETMRQWERIILVLALAGIGALATRLVDFVPNPGLYMPPDDMGTDYRVGFLWAATLWLSLLVWPMRPTDKRALLYVWLIKVMVVLGAMLLVESHYKDSDSYIYFAVPRRDGFQWPGFAFGDGTTNILSLSWLHHQIIPNSYHAMKVSFAMVGLIAVYVLYRAAMRFLGREDIRVLYLLALFPGILFWSSIVGKDPVMLLGIGLYVYGVVGLGTHRSPDLRRRLVYAILVAAGLVLASLIRVWLGPILLAPLAVFVLCGVRNIFARALVVVIVAGAFDRAMALSNDAFNVETSEDLVERADHISHTTAQGSWDQGGSSQAVTRFQDLWSMTKFVPVGAFTALFRPLPGEVLNPFGLLAGLENLVLLALLLRAIKRATWRDMKQPLVLWATTLILVWSVVYGFASTQNLGTAVRWKLQVLPLLVGLLCYLGRRRSREAANVLVRPPPSMRPVQA
jgi:hypothetical protein